MLTSQLIETDDRAIPGSVRLFFWKRLFELCGALLFGTSFALGLSIANWNSAFGAASEANYLFRFGYQISDILIRSVGLASILFVIVPMAWASTLIAHKMPYRLMRRIIFLVLAVFATAIFFDLVFVSENEADFNAGGALGSFLGPYIGLLSGFISDGVVVRFCFNLIIGFLSIELSLRACGFSDWKYQFISYIVGEKSSNHIDILFGRFSHLILSASFLLRRASQTFQQSAYHRQKSSDHRFFRDGINHADIDYHNQSFDRSEPRLANEPYDLNYDESDIEDVMAIKRVKRTKNSIKVSKRAKKEQQPSLFGNEDEFILPSLSLLSEPKHARRGQEFSDEALEANARLLENVLEDFGIRGEITQVNPGPVVTLYELEPAPGIKSSRVIGLADDIARSMSALSARVAVIPGKNAIGIELPNQFRETVFLRELLASEDFDKSTHGLSLALGKNIGGEPVFADLARMPHLLIAGTTGSGKSVGINTMILSILYRMSPEACRMIMIDPKMLELSVYEGIPHLLSPVVTDPKKAVVALKWTVREMEDRYHKMSKLGVRNIEGYNTRIRQAIAKGESINRTIQTGYDPESGKPVFETDEMELKPLPFIVVVIDEMADLMMVAGKDIEGAVQRLAQMARAAGIHVIMATQRPSVDVITGTIKANFPTRVSFQVTGKIDSRTILGEQGAEQLLGQGDMLYMAGGGRISRLHGAFVTDTEVEHVVKHLKAQGSPDYVESVTEDSDELFGGDSSSTQNSGDSLYDQAVSVVLRDKKVSTSYIQRRLQIGYNKAASLIERMESEGLISTASATGKREILVGSD